MNIFDFLDWHSNHERQMTKDLLRYVPLPVGPLVLLLLLLERAETGLVEYALVIALLNVSLVLEFHPRVRAFRNRYFS